MGNVGMGRGGVSRGEWAKEIYASKPTHRTTKDGIVVSLSLLTRPICGPDTDPWATQRAGHAAIIWNVIKHFPSYTYLRINMCHVFYWVDVICIGACLWEALECTCISLPVLVEGIDILYLHFLVCILCMSVNELYSGVYSSSFHFHYTCRWRHGNDDDGCHYIIDIYSYSVCQTFDFLAL